MSNNIIIQPNPKQKLALTLKTERLLLSGGVRGGKTSSGLWKVIKYCQLIPGSKACIMRSTYKEIKSDIWEALFNPFTGPLASKSIGKLNKSEMTYKFKNGSIIEFLNADRTDALLGREYSIIYLEQAEYIPKKFFEALLERNTWWGDPSKPNTKGYIYEKTWANNNKGMSQKVKNIIILSCNPNKHSWIYDTFIRTCKDYSHLKPHVKHNILTDWDIVNFQSYDNLHFVPDLPKWLAEQKQFNSETEYQRKVEGAWVGAEGLIWHFFDMERNTFSYEFKYDKDIHDIFVSIDPGKAWFTGIIFGAYDRKQKQYIVFDEMRLKDIPIEDICTKIHATLQDYGIGSDVNYIIDAAANELESNGVSRSEQYIKGKIYVRNANKTLDGALERINGLLREKDIIISRHCISLISDIQAYSKGVDGKPDKGVGNKAYDMCDAMRYFCNEYGSGGPEIKQKTAIEKINESNLPPYQKYLNYQMFVKGTSEDPTIRPNGFGF